jgi:hypothetical protein
MATEQQGGSAVTASSTINNGGTAINVGTSTVLDTRAPGAAAKTVFASTPIDNDSADKALSGGTFAFNNQTGLIMRVTDSLATVSNDVLVSAADDVVNARSINQISGINQTNDTSSIRNGNWNAFSGAFSPAITGGLTDFGIDEAANPSRGTPGELAYMDGSPNPTTDEYSVKNT